MWLRIGGAGDFPTPSLFPLRKLYPPTFFSTTRTPLAAITLSYKISTSTVMALPQDGLPRVTMRGPPTLHHRRPSLAWSWGAAPIWCQILLEVWSSWRCLQITVGFFNEAITATEWYMFSTACFRTNLRTYYTYPSVRPSLPQHITTEHWLRNSQIF